MVGGIHSHIHSTKLNTFSLNSSGFLVAFRFLGRNNFIGFHKFSSQIVEVSFLIPSDINIVSWSDEAEGLCFFQ